MKWYLRDFIAIISWSPAPRYASRIFSFLSAVLLTKRNNLLKVTQPLNLTILTQPFLRDKIPWCHSNEHHFSSLFNYPNSILNFHSFWGLKSSMLTKQVLKYLCTQQKFHTSQHNQARWKWYQKWFLWHYFSHVIIQKVNSDHNLNYHNTYLIYFRRRNWIEESDVSYHSGRKIAFCARIFQKNP